VIGKLGWREEGAGWRRDHRCKKWKQKKFVRKKIYLHMYICVVDVVVKGIQLE
jgi:hypothetical protein